MTGVVMKGTVTTPGTTVEASNRAAFPVPMEARRRPRIGQQFPPLKVRCLMRFTHAIHP